MLTRSKSKTMAQNRAKGSSYSTSNSATTTVAAEKLHAEAAHIKRVAELQIAVAEAEHRAMIASIEARGSTSQRSNESSIRSSSCCSRSTARRIRSWLDCIVSNISYYDPNPDVPPEHLIPHSVQTVSETNAPSIQGAQGHLPSNPNTAYFPVSGFSEPTFVQTVSETYAPSIQGAQGHLPSNPNTAYFPVSGFSEPTFVQTVSETYAPSIQGAQGHLPPSPNTARFAVSGISEPTVIPIPALAGTRPVQNHAGGLVPKGPAIRAPEGHKSMCVTVPNSSGPLYQSNFPQGLERRPEGHLHGFEPDPEGPQRLPPCVSRQTPRVFERGLEDLQCQPLRSLELEPESTRCPLPSRQNFELWPDNFEHQLRSRATVAPQEGDFPSRSFQQPAAATTSSAFTRKLQQGTLHNTLGTHNTNKCNIDNKYIETNTILQNLAQAIADVAPKTPKVCCPLPFFEGRPTDWLIFKKVYDETNSSFSPSENLVRLNSALRGAARDSVAVLLAAARDPSEVIRALETAFARPERIVLAEIASIRALPKLSSLECAKELNTVACRVRNCTEIVRLLRQPEYLASPELSNEIVGKLTPLLRIRWADFASSNETSGKFRLELLSDFLMREADLRSKYEFVMDSVKHDSKGKPVRESCHVTSTSALSKEVVKKGKEICLFCAASGHVVRDCKEFVSLSLEKRFEWANSTKVCRRCLQKGGHLYRKCKRFSCKVRDCSNKFSHHTLFHKDDVHVMQTSTIDSSTRVSVAHNVTSGTTLTDRPLLKIIAVTVTGPKGNYDTYALLDDGSTATLIDSSVANVIGAEGCTSRMRVDGISGMTKESVVTFVDIGIKGRHKSESYTLKNIRSIPNLDLRRQSVAVGDIKSLDYLSDIVDVLCCEDAKPMLLIGIDNWELSFSHCTRRGTLSQPVASLTALGWVLYGRFKGKYNEICNCVMVNHVSTEVTDSLDMQLKEYFRVDSIGITKKDYYSKSDQHAIQILENTTRRLSSGRFETGLLWQPDIPAVPDSYELARSRLLSLERKMKRDKDYSTAYRSNIHGMLSKNYAEPCDKEPKDGVVWYLPHFGVIHPQKRKLRVVHDAAATCRGVSLNTLLLPGPDILQPLLAILMRFREGRIALNGDLREMFPQTKIRLEDRNAQRFLWRDDPSQPIGEFRMSSMMFGAVSSPFTALFLKNRNAEDHRVAFPAAADAIVNDHYMDDFLGSIDTLEEAKSLTRDITHIHAQACLEMRAWVSNSKEALSLLSPDLALDAASVYVQVLGVRWNISEDTLCFSRDSFGSPPSKLTKRSVLAHLMRVYDPLGLLTPVTIRGRVLFQKTWRLGIEWDQELSPSFAAKWSAWFQQCSVLLTGSIPRHYLAHKRALSPAQLHVFADASELAYACVAYWRFECFDGSVILSLIGGKARLAPLKPLSIPRLELQAALIAARFSGYIVKAHKSIKVASTTLWSDSLTVLKWLRCDARTFKPYVAHRVGEIAEITNVSDWRYVPTMLNVADDATRADKKFEISSRWFTGPPFLALSPSEWPSEPSVKPPPVPEEMKRSSVEVVAVTYSRVLPSPVVPDANRFSRWLRLLRATARVFVCANIFKAALLVHNPNFQISLGPNSNLHREIAAENLVCAEHNLLLQSQLESLRDDYVQVQRGEPLSKNSRLKHLSLYIEEATKLLRLSGRISAITEVPTVSKNPIVLCGKNNIVRLLIAFYHERAAHANNELVVNELRQSYHIIGLRPAVKKVAASCLRCRIRRATALTPVMGDLPPERLAHHTRPFTFVGLDYFGPVTVTIGRRSEKRWVALFTCLTVRAIHMEIVGSLTTDSAVMALRRFIARRGAPTKLFSDNGTAFVGASRLLSKLYEQPVQDFAANHRIVWKFIPPAAPFMGGCWERLIKSVKSALSVTLSQQTPSEEVFHTFLLEVESLVNSRPLTHVGVSADEDGALTPFHFLIGSSSPYSVVAQVDDADLLRRVKWRRGLRLADLFWERWTREYLPTLIPRSSSTSSRSLAVGEAVLIVDGNLPRGVWPRGRVIKTFPGRDGVVRVVDVATSAGTLRRPVRKLFPLPS